MKLHPKIQELSKSIEGIEPNQLLSISTLERLKERGATATEASITLHLAFSIPLEQAGDYVNGSNLFPVEEINDSAYSTFVYMHYDVTGEE